MDDGLGRTGYRLLASVFLIMGLFGMVVAWFAIQTPTPLLIVIGLGASTAGLAFLFALSMYGTSGAWMRGAPSTGASAPASTVSSAVPSGLAASPTSASPAKESIEFEFPDPEPAPKAAPESMVLPPAFKEERPPAPGTTAPTQPTPSATAPSAAPVAPVAVAPSAPAARPAPRPSGKGTVTFQADGWPAKRQPVHVPGANPAPAPDPARRKELTKRYTKTTPMVRRAIEGGPVVRAEKAPKNADPDWSPGDKDRGQCGQCGTLLLAPRTRPLRLKCPVCEKVTVLE